MDSSPEALAQAPGEEPERRGVIFPSLQMRDYEDWHRGQQQANADRIARAQASSPDSLAMALGVANSNDGPCPSQQK